MVDLVTLAAAAVCGAISCRIFTYQRHGATYRFGVSLCAYILAAGTGMQALSISLAVLMARHATPISPYLPRSWSCCWCWSTATRATSRPS